MVFYWEICQAACMTLAFNEKVAASSVNGTSRSVLKSVGRPAGENADGIVDKRTTIRNEMHEIDEDDANVKDAKARYEKSQEKFMEKIKQTKDKQLKPMKEWAQDDVWTWLLKISQELAEGWGKLQESDRTSPEMMGTSEDIQERLAEKIFLLQGALSEEEETQEPPSTSNRPKAKNIIKWQNYDKDIVSETDSSKKTAGAILLMKTEKQIIAAVDSECIGAALYAKKSRVLKVEKKRKNEIGELEMARKRLQQGVRKPYMKR